MKKKSLKYIQALVPFFCFSVLCLSCSKQPLLDAIYPASTVYLNEAAITTVPSGTGIYKIAARIEGQTNTYKLDSAGTNVNIPLGVTRSGVNLGGSVAVSIAANTDTVNKMIAAGKLIAGTMLLPSSAYAFPASVIVADGSSSASFTLPVDLNFLISNISIKYAIGVTVSTAGKDVKATLSTVVLYIDPAQIILPVANYTAYLYTTTKTANFINFSANGVNYSWNFGDGTPVSTTVSPSHVYAASGTFPVTLTAVGITGNAAATTKTTSIIIP